MPEYTYPARTIRGVLYAVSFASPCNVEPNLLGFMLKGQQNSTGFEEEPGIKLFATFECEIDKHYSENKSFFNIEIYPA